MRIVDLIFKSSKKQTDKTKSYLSLTLTPNTIYTTIWEFDENENVQFLGFGNKVYTSVENLVHHTAVAIDQAGEAARTDVSDTVFGLSQSWFEDAELSKEASKILKNLAQDLELKPQAFVSLAAAISHLLKVEESITPQAVLVGIFENFCEVHLIKNNQIVSTQTASSGVNIEKISQIISNLKKDDNDLPARLIIYGPDEKSPIIKKLTEFNWSQLFVQEPKVDLLSAKDLAKATSYAQAKDILGHEPILPAAPTEKEKPTPAANEFGFVEGEDILKIEKPEPSVPPPETSEPKPEPKPPEEYAVPVSQQEPTTEEVIGEKGVSFLEGLKSLIPSGKWLAIVIAAIVIAAILGIFVAERTIVKAQTTIKFTAQSQDADFTASVSTSSQTTASPKIQIQGQEIISSAEGNQKAVATGTKKIGQTAKGEATVFNWTTSPKEFSGKTVIISKDGLKFTLDSDVQVASRSASTPGQAKVPVQAVEVGPKGNLSSGQDFTFQEFDELLYSAQSVSAFSGGDEKQVTVVSQEDLSRLEKSLTDTIVEKAKNELSTKTQGQKLHNESVAIKITRKDFDKKPDDEAALVNLDMTVEASAIVYNEENLKNALAASTQAPQNFQIRGQDIEITQVSASRRQNLLNLSGKYRAKLIPQFNEDELKDKIAGKSLKEVRAKILEIFSGADVQFQFSPNLPFLGAIPNNKAKVQIQVEAN